MNFKLLLIAIILIFSCKQNNKKEVEQLPAKDEIVAQQTLVIEKKDEFKPKPLSKLVYNLHPYSGYPIFTYDKTSDLYYSIIPIAKNDDVKDLWEVDELSYNENLISETKEYILKHINEYEFILLLVREKLFFQDGKYSPSENFNYDLYLKKGVNWIKTKTSVFKEDGFVFFDSYFRDEALKLINKKG